MMKTKPPGGRQSSSGFMLIEVMISVLIFAVGVLALVGLQVSMTRAQTEAKVRADASYLAAELVGLMWSDAGNLASYSSTSCSGYTPCSVWLSKVTQALPSATTVVTVDTSVSAAAQGKVAITITWQLPSGERHQYVTNTSVKS